MNAVLQMQNAVHKALGHGTKQGAQGVNAGFEKQSVDLQHS